MSWVARYLLHFHNWWNNVNAIRSTIVAEKTSNLQSNRNFKPLRIGVLGAAEVNFNAIIDPVSTHPSALITAIAARDKARAQTQIDTYKAHLPGEVKAYGSYDALVADPDIDAVYIPLPNGLHYKWALAALEAGKHVLIEKPITSNANEARKIREAASQAGKVALEAFHWRFFPASNVVKAILLSGEYGPVRAVHSVMTLPAGIINQDDIRFKYSLGGGSSMDETYVYSAAAYFAVHDITEPNTEFEVLEARPRLNAKDELIDDAMQTTIIFKDNSGAQSKATTSSDLCLPKLFGVIPRVWGTLPTVTIQCEKAEISFTGFAGPWVNHDISITPVIRDDTAKVTSRGKKITQKCYKGGPAWEVESDHGEMVGEDWWTSYRYQLEAFIRKIRETEGGSGYKYKGPWVSLDESVRIMEIIDAVYEKAGLPLRGQ